MAHAQAEIVVNATPDADLEPSCATSTGSTSLDARHRGLVSEGDDRVLSMMGMSIRERLVGLRRGRPGDHLQHRGRCAGRVPRGHDHGRRRGRRRPGRWDVTATPDEMAELMQGMYQQALEPLKTKAEG